MRAVHDKIEGPFAIEENISLYGMIGGDATLHRGVRFILHGTIAGNLTIERGARAIVHGTLAGRIYDSCRVEIFGIADAVTNGTPDAITIIDPPPPMSGGGHDPDDDDSFADNHAERAHAKALHKQARAACGSRRILY